MSALAELAYWFMPSELMVKLGMVLLVLGFVLRIIGLGGLGQSLIISAIALIAVPLVLTPVVEQALSTMPTWLLILIIVMTGIYLLRLILAVFLGRKAAGVAVGWLAARTMVGLIKSAFKLVRGFLRLLIAGPQRKIMERHGVMADHDKQKAITPIGRDARMVAGTNVNDRTGWRR